MNKTTILLMLLATNANAGGMIGNPNQPQASSTTNSNSVESVNANTPLRDLYKPSVAIGRDLKSTYKKEPLLNYATQTKAVQLSADIQKYCSAGGLVNISDDQGSQLVDTVTFNQIMTNGISIKQKRALWRQQVDQTDKADASVPRQRIEQLKAQQARIDQADENVVSANGRVDTRKLTKNIFKKFGLNTDPQSQKIASEMDAYDAFNNDLAYNRKIFQAQDYELKKQEMDYVNQLNNLYQNALQNMQKTPAQNTSLNMLTKFSIFRTNNIYVCTGDYVQMANVWPQTLNQDAGLINSPYADYVKAVIASHSAEINAKFKSATSPNDLQTIMQSVFPTDDLQRIAISTTEIADVYKARSITLTAEENARLEEQQKKLSAEKLRQQKLKQAALAKKIKTNGKPSDDELLNIIMIKSMNKTQKQVERKVMQVDKNSYQVFGGLLGQEWKLADYQIQISNVKCNPVKNKQICSYDETSTLTRYDLFGTLATSPNVKTHHRSEEFYWTNTGLDSGEIDVGALYWDNVSTGSSSASSGGRNYDDEADTARMIRDNDNYNNYINNGGGAPTRPYDSNRNY
jgi:hypothetical protein